MTEPLPDITPGLLVHYRDERDHARWGRRKVARVSPMGVVVIDPAKPEEGTKNSTALASFWDVFQPVPEKYTRTTGMTGKIDRPGTYRIEADADGVLDIAFFIAESDDDDEPAEPSGVWVVSWPPVKEADIVIVSIHETEVEALRNAVAAPSRCVITFVEYGAPMRRVIRETHSIR